MRPESFIAPQLDLATPPTMYCGECGVGHLAFDVASIALSLDRASRDADTFLAPTDFTAHGVFRCDFRCTSGSCGSGGYVVGRYSHSIEQTSLVEYDEDRRYEPTAFSPAPFIIAPVAELPDDLKATLQSAHAVLWYDASLCTMRCRVFTEQLLDHCKVHKMERAKPGRRRRLSLHDRIERLSASQPDLAELLLAAKWLGNSGAHTTSNARAEAVDALLLVDRAARMLFDDSARRIHSLARRVNRRKRRRG